MALEVTVVFLGLLLVVLVGWVASRNPSDMGGGVIHLALMAIAYVRYLLGTSRTRCGQTPCG